MPSSSFGHTRDQLARVAVACFTGLAMNVIFYRVAVAVEGMAVEQNYIYVSPPDRRMTLAAGHGRRGPHGDSP
jgi:chemotaxis response regulator CheB